MMAEYIVDTTDGIYNARTTGELVRCRDCKYYSPCKNDDDMFFCANFLICNVAPDDYCSHGEKREGKR